MSGIVRTDPSRYLWMAARQRARTQQLEFNLEPSDLIIPERCPILGLVLEFHVGKGRREATRANAPSVDRVDSTKGYIKGNVQVISWRANAIKSNGTAEDHQKISAYMQSHGVN